MRDSRRGSIRRSRGIGRRRRQRRVGKPLVERHHTRWGTTPRVVIETVDAVTYREAPAAKVKEEDNTEQDEDDDDDADAESSSWGRGAERDAVSLSAFFFCRKEAEGDAVKRRTAPCSRRSPKAARTPRRHPAPGVRSRHLRVTVFNKVFLRVILAGLCYDWKGLLSDLLLL